MNHKNDIPLFISTMYLGTVSQSVYATAPKDIYYLRIYLHTHTVERDDRGMLLVLLMRTKKTFFFFFYRFRLGLLLLLFYPLSTCPFFTYFWLLFSFLACIRLATAAHSIAVCQSLEFAASFHSLIVYINFTFILKRKISLVAIKKEGEEEESS